MLLNVEVKVNREKKGTNDEHCAYTFLPNTRQQKNSSGFEKSQQQKKNTQQHLATSKKRVKNKLKNFVVSRTNTIESEGESLPGS